KALATGHEVLPKPVNSIMFDSAKPRKETRRRMSGQPFPFQAREAQAFPPSPSGRRPKPSLAAAARVCPKATAVGKTHFHYRREGAALPKLRRAGILTCPAERSSAR